jgi:UPF0271 protein
MRVALDTSAIIYLNDFRQFEEIFTLQEILEELRDKVSLMKLSGLKLKVIEPSLNSVKDVKTMAKETGDLEKLSESDIKLLALAKEKKLVIISDDYSIQNVAEKMHIKYLSTFLKPITKLIKWRKFCKNCKKFYEKGDVCKKCGAKLIRLPIETKNISSKKAKL